MCYFDKHLDAEGYRQELAILVARLQLRLLYHCYWTWSKYCFSYYQYPFLFDVSFEKLNFSDLIVDRISWMHHQHLPSYETVICNNHENQDCFHYFAIIVGRKAKIEVDKCLDWLLGSLFESFCYFMDSNWNAVLRWASHSNHAN